MCEHYGYKGNYRTNLRTLNIVSSGEINTFLELNVRTQQALANKGALIFITKRHIQEYEIRYKSHV